MVPLHFSCDFQVKKISTLISSPVATVAGYQQGAPIGPAYFAEFAYALTREPVQYTTFKTTVWALLARPKLMFFGPKRCMISTHVTFHLLQCVCLSLFLLGGASTHARVCIPIHLKFPKHGKQVENSSSMSVSFSMYCTRPLNPPSNLDTTGGCPFFNLGTTGGCLAGNNIVTHDWSFIAPGQVMHPWLQQV